MITKREWLILYWCEGDKSRRGRTCKVALTSTDPLLLKLFIYGLHKFYGVNIKDLRCRLTIWENIDEKEAINFWSKELGIPSENFWKSYIRKSSKIRKGKHPYGTCRVIFNPAKVLDQIIRDLEHLKRELTEKLKIEDERKV